MIYTKQQTHDLESECIDLANQLDHVARIDKFGTDVTRDDLGTFHVNLCQLVRRADSLAKLLDSRMGFTRSREGDKR